jgi:hypothetical protein
MFFPRPVINILCSACLVCEAILQTPFSDPTQHILKDPVLVAVT